MILKSLLLCIGLSGMSLVIARPALADFHYTPSTTPSAGQSSMSAPETPSQMSPPVEAMSPPVEAMSPPVEAMRLTPPTVAAMPRSSANAPSYGTPAMPYSAPMPSSTMALMQDTTENLNAAEIAPMPLVSTSSNWKTNAAPATTEPIALPQANRLSGGAFVQGFGNQIPLVIALRQIVPESDQLTYGANVPLGSMVDWNGGKPWKDVLMSTLIPLGLTANETGSLIKIERM